MSEDVTITTEDVVDALSEMLENRPSPEVQQAMVDEIERLKAEGKPETEAVRLVFQHNQQLH